MGVTVEDIYTIRTRRTINCALKLEIMESQFQRLIVALVGAFIAGVITTCLVFNVTGESRNDQELVKEDVQSVQEVEETTVEVVYVVKNLFLRGWNDVINRYTCHTLVAMEYGEGESQNLPEFTCLVAQNFNIVLAHQPFPKVGRQKSCNILHRACSTNFTYIAYYSSTITVEKQFYTEQRCRGPGLQQSWQQVSYC